MARGSQLLWHMRETLKNGGPYPDRDPCFPLDLLLIPRGNSPSRYPAEDRAMAWIRLQAMVTGKPYRDPIFRQRGPIEDWWANASREDLLDALTAAITPDGQ